MRFDVRTRLAFCSALASTMLVPAIAHAQDAPAPDTGTTANVGLEDIVVTAQRREQRLQDVPIAVTALTSSALQANRVMSVNDLSGLAPGVTVRPAAGGSQIPSFTVRGVISYGVVPGSDKEVSVYLDGVYISSPRGSIFDLPDVERIEMLRGPQGTLFGRNATAGAVSISTRDPTGEPGITVSTSVGNYDQKRFRMSAEAPAIGPFNFYGSFVYNYRRGEIRNAGAGQLWDLSNAAGYGVQRSPRYLGTKDNTSYFGAVKFEPSDSFSTIYKFDREEEDGTPEGTGFIGYNPAAPLIGNLLGSLINSQPTPVFSAPDGKRPKVVSNSFALPTRQRNTGHSLTSIWQAADKLTIKNIAAYRSNSIFASSPIDGFSGLIFTPQAVVPYATFAAFSANPALATAPPAVQGATIGAYAAGLAPLVGSPFLGIATHPTSSGKQWSDELQANYTSDLVTLTVGALYFKSKDRQAGPFGIQNTYAFAIIPGAKFPIGNIGQSLNNARSLAAYAQAEVHVTPQVDVILGGRVTKDKKYGSFNYGNNPAALTVVPFTYKKTKPNYLIGINYKPTDDILLYGKYSTAFVSGGSVAGLAFRPETVASYEGGIKADLFDRRLRTNLAVYTATYKHLQTAQGSSAFKTLLSNVNGVDISNAISTFILEQGGPVKAHGFELEVTAAPTRGLTIGGNLGYTKTKFYDPNPVIVASQGGFYEPTLRPKWNGSLYGMYQSEPIFEDATLMLRMDANYRSKYRIDPNPTRAASIPIFANVSTSPATWILNGRAALRHLSLGDIDTELAVWGRNLTNNRAATYALIQSFEASANYEAARTYGLDLTISF